MTPPEPATDRANRRPPGRLRTALRWLAGHELIVLLGMLIVVAGTWGFIELADEVLEGSTQQLDERLVRGMRRADDPAKPIGPDAVAEMARDSTALGGYLLLTLMTAAVVGYLLITRRKAAALFVLAAVLSGFLLTMGLKRAFDRPRPDVVPHLSHVQSKSFPSGHSMMSAVVYLTLGALLARFELRRGLRFYFIAIAAVLTLLAGVSRVYLGVHYPTDVLAGWTAGLVWATLCWLTARFLQRRGRMGDADHRR